MIEVKIRVKYKLDYSCEELKSKKCKAEVSIVLPTNEHGELIEELRGDEFVLGDRLDPTWGSKTEEGRVSYQVLSARNWIDLKEQVREKIAEVEEILKEVKKENKKLKEQKPEDEVIVLKI